MASGSIKHSATQSNSSPIPQPVTSPSRVGVESSHTSGNLSFASSLRNSTEKEDYLEKASELIALAVQKEVEQEFAVAFSYYRRGVDLLLQGVQGMSLNACVSTCKAAIVFYWVRVLALAHSRVYAESSILKHHGNANSFQYLQFTHCKY